MRKFLFRLYNLFCVMCLILFSSQALAQSSVIGTVTDAATGEPLIGATVVVLGTSTGTVTDLDGNYEIRVPGSNAVLEFTYVGYETQDIEVGNQTTINVAMIESATELEDVVVIGYGTVKKEDLTGAVAVVTSEDLNRTPAPNFQKALAGKAPGVIVTSNSGAPGAGASIKIRGIGSINRNGNPIYVIDGIITGSLNSINPADIESMQVLKDASAAAIYGADGANGVIIITTKRGQSGATKVSYSGYYSINRVPKKLNLMNASEYADFYNAVNVLRETEEFAYSDEFRQFYYGDGWEEGTDWQDAVTQPGFRHNQYVRISGGGKDNNFSISGNYFDERGIIINTGAKRYNFRANSDFNIGKRLKVGETFNISRLITQHGGGIFDDANIASPLMKIYNEDNKEGFEGPQIPFDYDIDPSDTIIDRPLNTGGNDKTNPVAAGSLEDDFSYSTSILGNLYAELTIFDWLKYRLSGSAALGYGRRRTWRPAYDLGVRSVGNARLDERYNDNMSLQLENQLTFQKQFGDHGVTATAVYQVRKNDNYNLQTIGNEFKYEYLYTMNGAEQSSLNASGTYNPYRMISYLGRVIYDYKNKILFTGSIRRDGVSVFASGNRFGNFPSASLAYKINEDLLQDVDAINMLKIRAGWGSTGNSSIGSFQFDDFLSPPTDFHIVFGTPNVKADAQYLWYSFANPLIRWESAEMLNFGLDLNAFNNKVQASAEYYIKSQNDLLVQKQVSYAHGRARTDSAPFVNIGGNRNTGVEVSLSYRDYGGLFQYSAGINFTSIKNEVISLPVKNIIDGNNITVEGHTIGSLYGYVADRLVTPEDFNEEGDYLYAAPTNGTPEPGDIKYRDLNNDGLISDADRTIIGKALPDMIIGANFECSYRNFDLSLFLNSMVGYEVFNAQRSGLQSFVDQDIDHNKDLDWVNNYYTIERPTTEYVRADPNNSNQNNRISTWWVEEASFVRIRDVQLGYNLPERALQSINLERVRVYVSAENPYVFTNYQGRDPENAAFSNPLTSGTDGGGFPNPRVITFGAQVDF